MENLPTRRRRRVPGSTSSDIVSTSEATPEDLSAISDFETVADPRDAFANWEKILQDVQNEFIEQSSLLGDPSRVREEEFFYNMAYRVISENYPEVQPIEMPDLINLLRSNLFGYGVLESYMKIEGLEELYFNRYDQGFFIANGQKYRIQERVFYSPEDMRSFLERVATENGLELNLQKPILDAALTDGSRINASIEPIAVDGADFIIRKHREIPFNLENMLSSGVLSKELAEDLRSWVAGGLNIIVSGGTASGKTSFLNMIGKSFIPPSDRVLVLENRKELQIQTEDCKYFQTREDPTNPGHKDNEITLEVLVRATLRKRPRRIIVGEIRGAEAYYALEAWNTGHEGSLCTIHANSGIEALARLESLASRAGQVDHSGVRRLIGSSVDIIIQLHMDEQGKRMVREVVQVLHPYKYRNDDPFISSRVEELREGPYWQEIRDDVVALQLYRSPGRGQPAVRVSEIVPIIGRGPDG